MSTNVIRLISIALLFVVIILTGFILSRAGKPYGTLLTTVHKLLSVGLIVSMVMTVIKINKASTLSLIEFIVCIAAAICFLALVATGGMMTTDKEWPPLVTTVHKILPYFTVILTAIFVFMQIRRK